MMLTIERFNKTHTAVWNDFLSPAKNGLFLFNRSYMEYHEDRYVDHSLMVYNSAKLLALFPANEKDGIIYSHAGLTFGGVILSPEIKTSETMQVFDSIINYFRDLGFAELIYKAIPYIFHRLPAQEDLYSLTRNNAKLYRRDVSSVIDLSNSPRFSETKRRVMKKCIQAGVIVQEQEDLSAYWPLLESVLSKFSVKPVHSLHEITKLRTNFKSQIRLFEASLDGELLAGILLYDYGQVVHTQYMANSIQGRTMGALDFLNFTLIHEQFNSRKFYSFGISTEKDGKYLNEGLIQQKERMGGRAVVHDFYKITL